MEKTNKYWDLSWWFIFDHLDRSSHNTAIDQIWECVTVSANIDYMWKVTHEELCDFTIYTYTKIWDRKCIVETCTKWVIFWKFIFIKI